MGSTQIQDIAEGQGVRRQKENRAKRAKQQNQAGGTKKEEPTKRKQGKRAQKRNKQRGTKQRKPPASIEGKLILAGGKLKAGRSLEVVGDAEGGGEDTVV